MAKTGLAAVFQPITNTCTRVEHLNVVLCVSGFIVSKKVVPVIRYGAGEYVDVFKGYQLHDA
jgi:hypothetical protein